MMHKLQIGLFYILVALLPINLGKHFIVGSAFVKGHLIDYLVPTVWLTDLIIFMLLVIWMFSGGLKEIFRESRFRLFFLFLLALLPSVIIAENLLASAFFYILLVLRVFFVFFVISKISIKTEFSMITRVFAGSVIFLSFVAFLQWFLQSSVFSSYLFFGEQPYNMFSTNIALTNFFGELKIPPYSIFRHPNIFGGFLSVLLVWIFYRVFYEKAGFFYKLSFFVGTVALFLTSSEVAMASLILGVLFVSLIRKFGKKGVLFSLSLTFLIFMLGLFLHFFPQLGIYSDYPSIFRRANLQRSAYMMLDENALFGVGLNNFTVRVEDFLPATQVLRFIQPVHNIFVLVFSETGIFGLILFVSMLLYSLVNLLRQPFGIPAILFVSLLQFFILGSFDHYLFTVHQTQTLVWLTLGLSLTYTERDVEV